MSPRPDYLILEALGKNFGSVPVLEELSLAVAEGEIFALLGPSGSGKTTALRLLAGFEKPDRGRIRVAGEDVTAQRPDQRRFGMVFQHYALFPHLSVGENVAFGLPRGPEQAERVAKALAQVQLPGFESRPATALSGGQQQRVALARALAPRPRILLLDEPLSNLDPALRDLTRRALADTVREVGITTVIVTHEQEEAFELADRVGVLYRGRLAQVGTPEELYARPADRFVATFVGRASVIPARPVSAGEGGRATVELALPGKPVWQAELAPGAEKAAAGGGELVVRPEALELAGPEAAGALAGEVVSRRFAGASTFYRVDLGGELELEVAAEAGACRLGDRVAVRPSGSGPAPRFFASEPAA